MFKSAYHFTRIK